MYLRVCQTGDSRYLQVHRFVPPYIWHTLVEFVLGSANFLQSFQRYRGSVSQQLGIYLAGHPKLCT